MTKHRASPLPYPPTTEESHVAAHGLAPARAGELRPKRLLVVHGGTRHQEAIRPLLLASRRLDGWQLDSCASSQAKSRIRERRYECIVVDQERVEADHSALLRAARESVPPVPTILVTHTSDPGVAVAALRDGAYDFFARSNLDVSRLCASIDASVRWAAAQADAARAHARAQQLSFYDGLTGLPNRNLFIDRLDDAVASAARYGGSFALMMLDLDGFKEVNDTHGHAAGDDLLIAVSQRIASIARRADTFARLGGDEFAGLLPGCDSPTSALLIAEKIVGTIEEPFVVGGALVHVGISVGVAVYPYDGLDRRSLLANADRAMYGAKRRGSHCEACTPGPHSREAEREASISASLASQLASASLPISLRPLVDPETGEAQLFRATPSLLHPEHGAISYRALARITEASCTDEAMTERTLDVALAWLNVSRLRGHDAGISVPVSARLFLAAALEGRLERRLAEYGASPTSVTLEISEDVSVTHGDRARRVVTNLRRAGFGVAIADFGASFSALRQLYDLNVTQVRIAPFFIREALAGGRAEPFVRAMVAVAHGAGAIAVAEADDADDLPSDAATRCDRGTVFARLGALGCDLVELTPPEVEPIASTDDMGDTLRSPPSGWRRRESVRGRQGARPTEAAPTAKHMDYARTPLRPSRRGRG